MPIAQVITTGRVPVKVWTPDLEATARRQLENVSQLPIVHGHIAAMPDVHAGVGATVGSVIPTKGVECRKDSGVVDEIPGAYKPIAEVMANQSDLVDVVHTLKQVLCVKG
jgi:RNA-splicing ligase RtcB